MEKLLRTLVNNIDVFASQYFIPSLSVAVFALIVYLFFSYLRGKKQGLGKYVTLFVSVFYLALLLYTTLIKRIGTAQEPLSNVFGDWWIWDTDYIKYVNMTPVTNVIMTMPMFLVLALNFKYFYNKSYSEKNWLIISTVVSFLFSLFIETMQLIFKLGTFQISDLVYNTLGGLIGALLTLKIIKIVKKDTGSLQ